MANDNRTQKRAMIKLESKTEKTQICRQQLINRVSENKNCYMRSERAKQRARQRTEWMERASERVSVQVQERER